MLKKKTDEEKESVLSRLLLDIISVALHNVVYAEQKSLVFIVLTDLDKFLEAKF